MKIYQQIKAIPFLVTLIIIIILNINNQKESTKLRFLIWSTPSLSIGTYLSISAGTGFIISYIITSTLVKFKESNHTQKIKYKADNIQDDGSYQETNDNRFEYDNILVERDIKEPSPTINASFRVIGNVSKVNEPAINIQYQDNIIDNSEQSNDSYYKNSKTINTENKINSKPNDWNDETFNNW